METPIVEEVVEQLKGLPQELQARVLEFTKALAQAGPRGNPGRRLLRFAGTIPLNDAKRMSEAIEQGCERVDADEW